MANGHINFRTRTYTLIGRVLASVKDTQLTVKVANAADYIGPSRELQARLAWVPTQTGSVTLSARVDLANWQISRP